METRPRPTTRTTSKTPSTPRLRWLVSERFLAIAKPTEPEVVPLAAARPQPIVLAATNKCLAQTNKSGTRAKATDKRRSDTGSAAQLRAPPTARPVTGQRCRLFHDRWNGRWWAHTRFCSAYCEGKYELERYNANAKQHRWYTFFYRSSPQS